MIRFINLIVILPLEPCTLPHYATPPIASSPTMCTWACKLPSGWTSTRDGSSSLEYVGLTHFVFSNLSVAIFQSISNMATLTFPRTVCYEEGGPRDPEEAKRGDRQEPDDLGPRAGPL